MHYNTPSFIEQIENVIVWQSFRLPLGYVMLNRLKVEALIDNIYASLPEDMYMARKNAVDKINLVTANNYDNNMFEGLKELENELNKFILMKLSIVKLKKVQKKIDDIKCSFKNLVAD